MVGFGFEKGGAWYGRLFPLCTASKIKQML
jgi:hypothetical protein